MCTDVMKKYLTCIKKVKGVNENECRELAKSYLSCRMDRNLMAPDDFKNLGFQSPTGDDASSKTVGGDNSQDKPT
ncbi:Cytochrome c oxidase assembly protein cox19 [Cytospora paraplurivora]|uniref:Cytochrome c oxidase assembly protein cox19 n=1 Tax=Cytospora paraplurivora TaxID=2898453 RepID=A0AAN9UFD1_9PEZI